MDIPPDQKARFAQAIRTFSGVDDVSVTPEKLGAFLEATGDIQTSSSNRLHRLAIELENAQFEQGWKGLRAIYQAAAAADPSDAGVLHSWGLAASRWAKHWMTPDLADRIRIADEAVRILHQALELSPRNGRIAHTLGLAYYNHPARANDEESFRSQAIDWFTQAVEWESGDTIAQLYLAHCFHDRKDWPRAIAEYEKIDLERLSRDWHVWRSVKCQEQVALCHAYAGDREEATRRFSAFLDQAELWDAETLEDRIMNVDELVVAATKILNDPRLLERTRTLVDRLGLKKHYGQLD
jgi:tetratricopeptide (TPR) repeat protein